jgi:hypothetical protein
VPPGGLRKKGIVTVIMPGPKVLVSAWTEEGRLSALHPCPAVVRGRDPRSEGV